MHYFVWVFRFVLSLSVGNGQKYLSEPCKENGTFKLLSLMINEGPYLPANLYNQIWVFTIQHSVIFDRGFINR